MRSGAGMGVGEAGGSQAEHGAERVVERGRAGDDAVPVAQGRAGEVVVRPYARGEGDRQGAQAVPRVDVGFDVPKQTTSHDALAALRVAQEALYGPE